MTVQEYKSVIDESEEEGIKSAIALIKNADDISYIDRQKLMYYGYYKMDYFEEAAMYLESIMFYCREFFIKQGKKCPEVLMSLDDFFAGMVFSDLLDGAEAGGDECCGGCCMACIFCTFCNACCDGCGNGGSLFDAIAEDSNCCLVQCGLPAVGDCCTAGWNIICGCMSIPVECCAGCCL